MALSVNKRGDVIELGAGGAYRLEQAVLAAPDAADPEARPWKLYKRTDTNGVAPDGDGNDQPTSYTYRYEHEAEFIADDEEAAIKEARRLISEG